MKKLLTLIILIITIKSIAQDKVKLDSLWMVYNQAKHDTTRIKILNEKIGYLYESINADSAILLYNKAIDLADNNCKIKTNNYKKFQTLKANSLRNIGIVNSSKGNSDNAVDFFSKSLKIHEEISNKQGMADCYMSLGNVNMRQGNYDKAIEYHSMSLKINNDFGNKMKISQCYTNIGNVHYEQGDYDNALEFYFKSLKITEKTGDRRGMSACYANIGSIYFEQKTYDNAIEYNLKALKIKEEIGDKRGMTTCYINLGNQYLAKVEGSLDSAVLLNIAVEYYKKALNLAEEFGYKKGISMCYNNLGIVCINLLQYDKAIEYYVKALKINEDNGNKKSIALSNTNIALLYSYLADSSLISKNQKLHYLNKSIEFGTNGFNLAQEIKALSVVNEAASALMKTYKMLDNFKKSLEYSEIFIATKDSMFSEEKTKSLAEMGTKYESEKKQLQIEKLNKENELQNETIARKDAESKKQRILIFSFFAGFIIILFFSIFIYRLFRQKKKANLLLTRQKHQIEIQNTNLQQANEEINAQRDEIEAQRDLVTIQKNQIEHIHNEVTDSINYAKRIQEAVLPISEEYRSIMGEHFALFRPKDIVSGDFYWTAKIENTLIVAVADCTGHGVPGAFMSMLGISFLNEIIRKKEILKANEVLNELRKEIISALQQKGQSGEQKDGMDISLVVIKTQAQSSKNQISSSKLQYEEGNQYSVSSKQSAIISEQLADNNTELQSSEMFIEKESNSDTELQSSEIFIEKESDNNKDLSSKSQIPNSIVQGNDEYFYKLSTSQLNIRTIEHSNNELQTTNNKQSYHAQWSGANNPLWVVRSDETLTGFKTLSEFSEDASANNEQQTTTELASSTKLNHKLFEIKPDKMPIAIYEKMDSFTNHELQLQKGDCIYLMTDGYEDQFGGLKGKKFLSKNLKQLIVANCQLPMIEQNENLEKTLVEWIGEGEQVDDITILGIKI